MISVTAKFNFIKNNYYRYIITLFYHFAILKEEKLAVVLILAHTPSFSILYFTFIIFFSVWTIALGKSEGASVQRNCAATFLDISCV